MLNTKAVISGMLLSLSLSTQAAIITSDENAGFLPTGGIYVYFEVIGDGIDFAHAVNFTTDSNAQLSSGTVIDLELLGVSGFTGDLTMSLYEGTFQTNDSTIGATLASPSATMTVPATSGGISLANIPVLVNQNYSLVIEGMTIIDPDPIDNNTITGSISVSGVPVPGAAWLFGSAVLGLGCIGRTRRTAVS